MKRPILSSLLAISIFTAPALKADTFSEQETSIEQTGEVSPAPSTPTLPPQAEEAAPLATDPAAEDLSDMEGTAVGQASNEGVNTAKRKQLRNIAIAAVAVAVAVTALIVVSSNNGHRSKH